MRRLFCHLGVVLLAIPASVHGQESVQDDVVAQTGEFMPDGEDARGAAARLVAMTGEMVRRTAEFDGDCGAMKSALGAVIEQNRQFMDSLDYATEQAGAADIEAIHQNAEKLGKLLGKCYDDAEIRRILLKNAGK